MTITRLQEIFLICGIAVGGILLTALIIKRKNSGHILLSIIIFLTLLKQYLTVVISSVTTHHLTLISLITFLTILALQLVYYYILRFTHPLLAFRTKYFFLFSVVSFFAAAVVYLLGNTFEPATTSYVSLVISVVVAAPLFWRANKNIKNFEVTIKDNFSDLSRIHLSWIKLIVQICFILLSINILDVVTGPDIQIWKLSPVFATISIFALTLFTLNYSKVFEEIKQNLSDSVQEPPFSPEDAKKYEAKLLELFEKEKPYLNTQFNLRDLSAGLGLKPYKTSELINSVLKTNFYALINSKRVEHAKKLLLDQQSAHLNMLGIADQSGFNSKSVFNDAFKKITGITPKQFRAQNLTE